MTLNIIIGLATMLIALNGLLFQPKKDPEGRTNWKNINTYGRILFGLLILLTILNIAQSYYDEKNHSKEVKQLLASQEELKEINRHLIKVMSVADGYNAVIRGTVFFATPIDDNKIRAALNNVFLKYARIELRAANKLGEYKGRIDYATHPEVRKYLRLSDIPAKSFFSRYKKLEHTNSYFFEIRCSKLKILNHEKIQYARFRELGETLKVSVETFEWSEDFNRLYNVIAIYLEELEIEELDNVRLDKWLSLIYAGNNATWLTQLGFIQLASGLLVSAKSTFSRALEIDINSSDNWLGYMVTLYKMERYQEALEAAQKVREYAPNSIEALRIIAHSNAMLGINNQAISAYLTLNNLDSIRYEKEIQALSVKKQ